MFTPEQNRRHDMPVVFGPSQLGARAHYAQQRTIAHTFHTDPEAVEHLIPYHFTLAEPARVVIASAMLIGVDWLGGRNYHNVRISVHVKARHGDAEVRGPFHLVDWESDPRPVIAGREYLGIPKLVGEIPEHEYDGADAAFECSEYGTRLLRGEVANLAPAPEEILARKNSGADLVTLGWKYIPGPGGTVDVDYPTMVVSRARVDAVWMGEGSVEFDRPTWEQCPLSARIVEAVAALPVVEVLPGTYTLRGPGVLDRDASIRLG